MPELAEVGRAEPVQRRTIELGRAADEVVDLRLERLALGVVPGIGRYVPAVDEDLTRIPVLHLAGEEVATLQDQDSLAGWGDGVGERTAAGPGPDDDDVVLVCHDTLPCGSVVY